MLRTTLKRNLLNSAILLLLHSRIKLDGAHTATIRLYFFVFLCVLEGAACMTLRSVNVWHAYYVVGRGDCRRLPTIGVLNVRR